MMKLRSFKPSAYQLIVYLQSINFAQVSVYRHVIIILNQNNTNLVSRVEYCVRSQPYFLHILSAFRAQDVAFIGQKATTHEAGVAAVAAEAVAVPVAVIERDELCSAQPGDGARAAAALLGEELAEAVSAVGRVVTRRELLPGQDAIAVRAREAVAVERV